MHLNRVHNSIRRVSGKRNRQLRFLQLVIKSSFFLNAMKILFGCFALSWISLCFAACSFDPETGISTCHTYTQWTESVEGAVSWAKDCDFKGHDIAKLDVPEHNCGKLCYNFDKGQCTHFTWSKGICYIKSNARKKAEEPSKSEGDICGSMCDQILCALTAVRCVV